MKFTRTAADPGSMARCGVFTTDHGEVKTPIFMPVGTVGSVKGVYHKDLREDINAEIILGNTYHLYLRPGLDTLRKAGGLHKFESWDRPILTDSGGFQVFSLTQIRKITEEGCRFRSHIDGSSHMFTPENNVDTQRIIGSDIMMALDECCPGDADKRYASKSLKLTQGWLERFFKRFKESEPLYGYDQAMFPIIQGCVYPDLRKRAVADPFVCAAHPFKIIVVEDNRLPVGRQMDIRFHPEAVSARAAKRRQAVLRRNAVPQAPVRVVAAENIHGHPSFSRSHQEQPGKEQTGQNQRSCQHILFPVRDGAVRE